MCVFSVFLASRFQWVFWSFTTNPEHFRSDFVETRASNDSRAFPDQGKPFTSWKYTRARSGMDSRRHRARPHCNQTSSHKVEYQGLRSLPIEKEFPMLSGKAARLFYLVFIWRKTLEVLCCVRSRSGRSSRSHRARFQISLLKKFLSSRVRSRSGELVPDRAIFIRISLCFPPFWGMLFIMHGDDQWGLLIWFWVDFPPHKCIIN